MNSASTRPGRRALGFVLLSAVLATGVACRPPGGRPCPTAGTTPYTSPRCPLPDQTPPVGTNGVVWRDGELWIADLEGNQIVVVEPNSGAIVARYGAAQGITGKPDDLVIARDGTVYWTGFESGVIGRLRPGQPATTLATIEPGLNPIAFGPDGQLYVARAMTGDGFYRVDPTTGQVTKIADTLGNVNAFAFGRDGQLYAPSMGAGTVVRIDPRTGARTTLAEGLPAADALRFAHTRLGGVDYGTAYVLSAYPVAVRKVDLTTGAVTVVKDTLPNPIGDNLVVAPDGRLFVTAYNSPSLSVIAPDGAVSTVAVGRAQA